VTLLQFGSLTLDWIGLTKSLAENLKELGIFSVFLFRLAVFQRRKSKLLGQRQAGYSGRIGQWL
jgi:hypothetical protein